MDATLIEEIILNNHMRMPVPGFGSPGFFQFYPEDIPLSDKIKVYPIRIDSEEALAKEIARVANQAMTLGYKLEDEKRILTKEEAFQQLGHSASLFMAILLNKEVLVFTRKVRPPAEFNTSTKVWRLANVKE